MGDSAAQIVKDSRAVTLILEEGGLHEVVLVAKVGDGYGLRFEPGLVRLPARSSAPNALQRLEQSIRLHHSRCDW
jgi:hypothetical protein